VGLGLEKIAEAYKAEFVGKRFVYVSKYGPTFGTVKDVRIHTEFDFSESQIKKILYGVKEKPSTNDWFGFRPVINIVSENENLYNLTNEKVYFLEKEDAEQ
jgi:hypothetical protein